MKKNLSVLFNGRWATRPTTRSSRAYGERGSEKGTCPEVRDSGRYAK